MLSFKKSICDNDHRNISSDEEELDTLFMDFKSNPYLSEFNQSTLTFDTKDTPSKLDLLKSESDTTFNNYKSLNLTEAKKEIISNDIDTENYSPITNTHEPSELRISTMTAVCNINIILKLDELYNNISFYDSESQEDGYPYIKSCQFASEPIKGYLVAAKSKRTKTKAKSKNCFQNQSTLIIALSKTRQINLKIFRNGKIQMTGLKSEEEGYLAANTLIKKIKDISLKVPSFITSETKEPLLSDFSIVLINSDFSAGFRIKREKLYELLFKSGMYVSYEPDIYPGVNAKYYWNTNNKKKDGICRCSGLCDGKGDGEGDGNCKKVTIATFQSGNVIITGARKNIQTQAAYKYINTIFRENMGEIIRNISLDEETIENSKLKSTKRISFNINKIINCELLEKLKNINL